MKLLLSKFQGAGSEEEFVQDAFVTWSCDALNYWSICTYLNVHIEILYCIPTLHLESESVILAQQIRIGVVTRGCWFKSQDRSWAGVPLSKAPISPQDCLVKDGSNSLSPIVVCEYLFRIFRILTLNSAKYVWCRSKCLRSHNRN